MKNIELDYQKNLRDIAQLKTKDGHSIKQGRLYRSGHLRKVSEEDIGKINSLRLTDIVDFRSSGEFKHRGDYPFEGVTQHNFPALSEDINKRHLPKDVKVVNGDFNLLSQLSRPGFNGLDWMKHTYIDLIDSEPGIKAYRDFFSLLQNKGDGVFLWHCSQGKDRAGLAAFFLEIALGVSYEDAVEDYLFTQQAMELKIAELRPLVEQFCGDNDLELGYKNLREVFSANKVFLDAAMDHINATYGDLESYLRNVIGVDFERLRSLYLD